MLRNPQYKISCFSLSWEGENYQIGIKYHFLVIPDQIYDPLISAFIIWRHTAFFFKTALIAAGKSTAQIVDGFMLQEFVNNQYDSFLMHIATVSYSRYFFIGNVLCSLNLLCRFKTEYPD
jgi:hypothetical protein